MSATAMDRLAAMLVALAVLGLGAAALLDSHSNPGLN